MGPNHRRSRGGGSARPTRRDASTFEHPPRQRTGTPPDPDGMQVDDDLGRPRGTEGSVWRPVGEISVGGIKFDNMSHEELVEVVKSLVQEVGRLNGKLMEATPAAETRDGAGDAD